MTLSVLVELLMQVEVDSVDVGCTAAAGVVVQGVVVVE